jgi:hypothetical protein
MEVLQRTANRGSISTGGYEIDNSCKFEADNTEYLERDPSSAGDRQKFTTSMWVKRTELGQASTIFGVYPTSSVGNTTVMQFGFMSTDKFQLGLQTYYVFNTTRLFRDTSAWYHIVVAFDTTQGTAANRIKLYVNGIQETAFDVEAYPNQNHTTGVNFTEPHRIGTLISNSWYFSGYIAEVNHVDGSQLAPTDFGKFDEDSGIWIPKKFTGSYGTNGFYLDFADGSDLGDDESGNGNDFTENNIAAADQSTDTPTNNFCTLNTISATSTVLHARDGATILTNNDTSNTWQVISATIGVTSGKWYWETQKSSATGNVLSGIAADDDPALTTAALLGQTSEGASIAFQYNNNSIANGSGSFTMVNGQTMMFALDMDNGALYFGKNGTWQNSSDPTSGSSKTGASALWSSFNNKIVLPAIEVYTGHQILTNFGGYAPYAISSAASDADGYGTFEYAPPSGYYALCTKNLAEYG